MSVRSSWTPDVTEPHNKHGRPKAIRLHSLLAHPLRKCTTESGHFKLGGSHPPIHDVHWLSASRISPSLKTTTVALPYNQRRILLSKDTPTSSASSLSPSPSMHFPLPAQVTSSIRLSTKNVEVSTHRFQMMLPTDEKEKH